MSKPQMAEWQVILCGLFLLGSIREFEGRSVASHHLSRQLSTNHTSALHTLIEEYKLRHLAATSDPRSGAKFVYAREFEYVGLGNNLPGIASAFLFALVTNRTLLLESPNLVSSLDLGPLDFHFENQVQRWEQWRVPSPDWYNMTWESHMDMWLLSDWNSDQSILRQDLIALDHEFDYPVALMEANIHVKPFLDRYFGHHDYFHEISNLLFPFKQPLVNRVETVCLEGFQRRMIGLQIRRLKGHGDYLPEVDSFAHLALAVQEARGWTDAETGFFVATDLPHIVNDVRAALPGRAIVYVDKDMKPAFQPNENPGTVVDALIDMRLLSMCDEIVITYGSSFGQVAAAWGGLKPYVLLFGSQVQNEQLPRMSQSRPGIFNHDFTSEPCCWHCPKISSSWNETIKAAMRRSRRWLHHSQCHW